MDIAQTGLGDAAGTMLLYREYPGSTGSMAGPGGHTRESAALPVITLDALLAQRALPCVDFIKCDVDGFEDRVLRGAVNTLCRHHPLLLVEVKASVLPAICQIIEPLGYTRGFFHFAGKLHAAARTADLPYRHSNALYRNFLFVYEQDARMAQLRPHLASP